MADTRRTLQKEIIHQTLSQMHCHPTASMVYETIHRTHPTISRSTVFRVLGQMAEEGRILRISLTGSDDRFDGTVSRHGHVRCRLCGAVADIPWVEMGSPSDTAGFLLEGCSVEYRGVCPSCQKRLEQEDRIAGKASL